MIKGQIIQQKTIINTSIVKYRDIGALNASMIRLFDSEPVKFYEQFKLGKKKKDKKSTALIIGDLVDFYLLDCTGQESEFDAKFDERFALYEGIKGTGQVFVLADRMFEVTSEYIDEKGEITTDFATRFTEAVRRVQEEDGKYKRKKEDAILEDFYDNGYAYFTSLMENIGKIVIDETLLDKAKTVGNILLNDEFTSDIFQGNSEEEILYKFPIEWKYKTNAGKLIDCKSELDLLIINHSEKKIYLKDVKTTYDNEGFEENYIRNGYYIQGAFYYLAVKHWAKQEGMGDYQLEPMEFIVGDTSANNRRPIRYQTSIEDVERALNGFTTKGIVHRGIHPIMEEISWAEDNNIWNCSKNVIDNKGKIKLKLNYE